MNSHLHIVQYVQEDASRQVYWQWCWKLLVLKCLITNWQFGTYHIWICTCSCTNCLYDVFISFLDLNKTCSLLLSLFTQWGSRNKVIMVWSNMEVSKWHRFHVWWTIPLTETRFAASRLLDGPCKTKSGIICFHRLKNSKTLDWTKVCFKIKFKLILTEIMRHLQGLNIAIKWNSCQHYHLFFAISFIKFEGNSLTHKQFSAIKMLKGKVIKLCACTFGLTIMQQFVGQTVEKKIYNVHI